MGQLQKQQTAEIANRFCAPGSGLDHFVEIGIGTGCTQIALYEALVSRGFRLNKTLVHFIGFDPSPDMCTQAQSNLEKAGLAGATRVMQCPGSKVSEYFDRSADVIYTAHTLHNIEAEERRATIENMSLALRDGGILSIVDKVAHDQEYLYNGVFISRLESIDAFFRSPKIDLPNLADYWILHEMQDHVRRYHESDLKDLLSELDFHIIHMYRNGPYVHCLACKK